MTNEEIKKVVTCDHKQKFRVKLADGTSKVVRLWISNGQPCIIDKGKRNWGHYLNSGWNFETKDWGLPDTSGEEGSGHQETPYQACYGSTEDAC